MKNICPVCGYDELELPPLDNNICPSCGTEFDYHDRRYSHAQLRQRWLAQGALWWDVDTPRPNEWSPQYIARQLVNVGYVLTDEDRQAIDSGFAREPHFPSTVSGTGSAA